MEGREKVRERRENAQKERHAPREGASPFYQGRGKHENRINKENCYNSTRSNGECASGYVHLFDKGLQGLQNLFEKSVNGRVERK